MTFSGPTIVAYWMSGGLVMIPLALVCFTLMYILFNSWKNIAILEQQLASFCCVEETYKQIFRRMNNDFLFISALTAAAPLLGLAGTVAGMLHTFDALSTSGSGLSGQMASGISEALITTQIGLVIAIPGLFGLSYLKRRLNQASLQFRLLKEK